MKKLLLTLAVALTTACSEEPTDKYDADDEGLFDRTDTVIELRVKIYPNLDKLNETWRAKYPEKGTQRILGWANYNLEGNSKSNYCTIHVTKPSNSHDRETFNT